MKTAINKLIKHISQNILATADCHENIQLIYKLGTKMNNFIYCTSMHIDCTYTLIYNLIHNIQASDFPVTVLVHTFWQL